MPLTNEPSPIGGRFGNVASDDPAYLLVRKRVLELTGIDLDAYKRQQMLRRLDAIMTRCQVANLTTLATELKPGSQLLRDFMERFTINVSECFRDRPRFEQLAFQIIPDKLKLNPIMKIWSAGCSYGAEPYSLALALREQHAQRATILATDVDPKIIEAARAGESFTVNDFKNVPKELVTKYFTPIAGEHFRAADTLRSLVTFKQHNLLLPAPGENFDIVLCRNVTIYFTEEAKDQVTMSLVKSLRPGGMLFIGETETIHRPARFGLSLKSTSFYERAA